MSFRDPMKTSQHRVKAIAFAVASIAALLAGSVHAQSAEYPDVPKIYEKAVSVNTPDDEFKSDTLVGYVYTNTKGSDPYAVVTQNIAAFNAANLHYVNSSCHYQMPGASEWIFVRQPATRVFYGGTFVTSVDDMFRTVERFAETVMPPEATQKIPANGICGAWEREIIGEAPYHKCPTGYNPLIPASSDGSHYLSMCRIDPAYETKQNSLGDQECSE